MGQETIGAGRKFLSAQLGFYVEFVAGDEQGRLVPLVFVRTILGRKNGDILVRDIKVSSTHIALEYQPEGFFLTDLGSSNGTFVGGKRVEQALVSLNEAVQVGDTVFVVKQDTAQVADLLKRQDTRIIASGGGISGLLDREFIQSDQKTAVNDALVAQALTQERLVRLKVIAGNDVGRKFAIKKTKVSLGRVNSDIVLNDPDVSRKHAVLEIEEGGHVVLRDLASSNGTFVNKIRISNCVLSPNDEIHIGKTVIVFEGTRAE